jgi:hypothetical protein
MYQQRTHQLTDISTCAIVRGREGVIFLGGRKGIGKGYRKILAKRVAGYAFLSQGERRNRVKLNETVSSDPCLDLKDRKTLINCSDNLFRPIFALFLPTFRVFCHFSDFFGDLFT